MKATRLILALIIAALVLTTGTAFAACIPAKDFGTWSQGGSTGYVYNYLRFGDTSITVADLSGRFWETNNAAAANNGTASESSWLGQYYAGADATYILGDWGAGTVGCPVGAMTVMVEDNKNGGFITMSANEKPGNKNFLWIGQDWTAASIPRPRVTGSGRSGTDVIVDVMVDDASGGSYDPDANGGGQITGVPIFQAVNPTSNDIAAGGWSSIGVAPNGGSVAGLAVDCSDTANNTSIAAGVEIEGEAPTTVGPATIIECDPNLADPGKFKLIERPSKPGNGKPIKRR
jgi:hypothetical protein